MLTQMLCGGRPRGTSGVPLSDAADEEIRLLRQQLAEAEATVEAERRKTAEALSELQRSRAEGPPSPGNSYAAAPQDARQAESSSLRAELKEAKAELSKARLAKAAAIISAPMKLQRNGKAAELQREALEGELRQVRRERGDLQEQLAAAFHELGSYESRLATAQEQLSMEELECETWKLNLSTEEDLARRSASKD
eukprot:TRINITY_DN25030_c0_g1_i1.p1 TRINITY_DN25030_c0_g1~~TRINITY_DN25030_c0_g1_i1.p1  ORF type:complete len:196 (+),score=58.99 TRINITY_DN25030_c0_g1_i1:140-727(+)